MRVIRDGIGTNRRRPHSWATLVALICAVLTTLVAVQTYQHISQANRGAQHQLRVLIEGEPGYNISQETVDAQMSAHPVLTYQPLTLRVTERWLSADKTLRGQLPTGEVVISSKVDNLITTDYSVDERFNGTGFDRSLAPNEDTYDEWRFDVDQAFWGNIAVGHGPKAVWAAAATVGEVIDDAPSPTPVLGLSAVGLGAMLSAGALTIALRYRSRWEARQRRLKAAQRKLARVVLDLEALEATYNAAPEAARPAGFRKNWQELQDLSLAAARQEGPLIEALFSKETALNASTGTRLTAFETDARTLTRLADSLMGAGSVHAQLAGTGSTIDTLSQPLNDEATALLMRVENAPGEMISGADLQKFRHALGNLLQAASTTGGKQAALDVWRKAERQLASATRTLNQRLGRYPHGRIQPPPMANAEYNQLRESLGLKPELRTGALSELRLTNALARAILGDTLGSDQLRELPENKQSSLLGKVSAALYPATAEPRKHRRGLVLGSLAALLVASMVVALFVLAPYAERPTMERDGSGQGTRIEVNDPAGFIDEQEVRRYLDTDFENEQQFLVAVRDAESYLKLVPIAEGTKVRKAEPESLRKTIWRIKDEYAQLGDPESHELPADFTIIPLLITDAGEGIIPGVISGEVISGTVSWGNSSAWSYGSISESKYPAMTVANTIDDFAYTLTRAKFVEPDFSPGVLFWILSFLIFFSVVNLVQLTQYLLGTTGRLGRFGRGAVRLKNARRQLERLALGLDDSQINAVAVLGVGAAGRADEAGQRLFERALMMAWRECEELSTLPLSERLRAGYQQRVSHLERLVTMLADRDADVARRAKSLVGATRGAGGDQPATVTLPGQG